MNKLTLSLMLSSVLALSSVPLLADTTEGYTALINGEESYAYNLFLEEAETDATAAYVVAMMNYEGQGVERNLLEAEKWLGFAAARGNQAARYNLGFLRNKGIFEDHNEDPLGLSSLLEASDDGNSEATLLAVMTLLESEDEKVPSFFTEERINPLLKNLERDFNKGNMFAAFALASYWMSADDYGGKADAKKAVQYLERAYNKGFKPALIGLTAIYRDGGANLPANPEKAQKYEAELMENFAMLLTFEEPNPQLVTLYDGMTKSQQKAAIKGLEKKAKAGDIKAIADITNRYENGLGVSQDSKKAGEYLLSLLDLGDEGKFTYGTILIDRNNTAGHVYILEAADNDYLPAIHWIIDPRNFYAWDGDKEDIMLYEQKGADLKDPVSLNAVIDRLIAEKNNRQWWDDEQRPDKVIDQEIYQWAIQLLEALPNDADTYYLMGEIYRNGVGVDSDLVQAYQSYEQALTLDPAHLEALLKLGRFSIDGRGTTRSYEKAAEYYLTAWNETTNIDAIDGLIAVSILTNQFESLPAIKSQIIGNSFKRTSAEVAESNDISEILLNELAQKLADTEFVSYYAYLIADRYLEKYLASEDQNQHQAQTQETADNKSTEYLQQALDYYEQSYRYSEQGKLHYINALLTLNETEENEEKKLAQQTLAVDLMMALNSLIVNAEYRHSEPYLASERNLTEAEKATALNIIFNQIEENETLQTWVGEKLIHDNPAVIETLESFASQNPPKAFAQYYLGMNLLKTGDKNAGYLLIEKAGNGGYLPAIYTLAENYLKEDSDIQSVLGGSPQNALIWYEKGVALKDDESIYQLAEIYFDRKIALGLKPGESDKKALYYYDQLSDPDYRFANFHRPDAIERVEEYRAIEVGAAAKEPDAIYQQASIYLNGRYGATIDEAKGEALLQEAADLGSIRAMKQFFDRDKDNPMLEGAALDRFNRYHIAIAESGDDWEMERLGDRYLQGERIEMDRAKAREWYQRSGRSSYELGYMHQFDVNLPLAEKGNAEAMLKVGRAYEHGNGIQKDHLKGYEWQKKAAEAGNSDAAFYFGTYAQEGVVGRDGEMLIEPDWPLAIEWYAKVSPRFKGTVEGRLEDYHDIYLPATERDVTAMIQQAKKMFDRYEYQKSPYYLEKAKEWAQKSIDAGNVNGYIVMMGFLPESEQKAYLTSLLAQKGDAQYQYDIAVMILDNMPAITVDDVAIAVENLKAILNAGDSDEALKTQAIERLIKIYQKGHDDQDRNEITAPDLQSFEALYQTYGEQFPVLLTSYGRYLLAQGTEDSDQSMAGISLLETAFERGNTEAALALYEFYSPGYYEDISLSQLENMETWGDRFIVAGLADSQREAELQQLQSLYAFGVYVDTAQEYAIASNLGEYWNGNGIDFVKDPQKAEAWYLRAFEIMSTKEIAEKLQKLAEAKYTSSPNTETLAEIYLYASLAKNVSNLDYPFMDLPANQRDEIHAKVVELEDDREFGVYKNYVSDLQSKASSGDKNAANRLARIYENGREARRNMDTAIEYYELAGSLGDANAYNRLGNLFRKDEENITPDYVRAVSYFEKGAELGDSNTAHLAGDMYYFGEGDLPKNYEKAAQYYDMTELKQGNHHALAKFKLAEIYYQGLIQPATTADYQKAYALLLLAKEYGETRASDALENWDFSMLTDQQKQTDSLK